VNHRASVNQEPLNPFNTFKQFKPLRNTSHERAKSKSGRRL